MSLSQCLEVLGFVPGKYLVSTSMCTLVLVSFQLMRETVGNNSDQFLCNQKEMASRFVLVDIFTLFSENMCFRNISNINEALTGAEITKLVAPFHIGLAQRLIHFSPPFSQYGLLINSPYFLCLPFCFSSVLTWGVKVL